MADTPSMSITAASNAAKANSADAAAAIQALFDHVEAGGKDARSAALRLESVAKHAPEAFEGQTDRFEQALETVDDASVRRELAGAVNELLDQQAIPPSDAGPALTEATRIRDEERWDDRPESELMTIRRGFDGWAELAAKGEIVPATVVERALGIAKLGNPTTLRRIAEVLQAAIESGSPRTEMAFEGLVDMSTIDDQSLTSKATLAVANLVVSGDVPDEDAAREVIAKNADVVQEEYPIFEEAPEDNQLVKEAREKRQLVEQAREELSV